MESILKNVSSFAVWGSLSATVILGTFFLVQAAVDRERRAKFTLFAFAMAYLASLDLSRSLFLASPLTYEWLRLFWGVSYAGCAIWLLGYSRRAALASVAALSLLGFGFFAWVSPALATTVVFPCAFAATAFAFAKRFWRERGYASALLAAYAGALALSCSVYFAVVARGDMGAILLGYLHYAISSVISVLLGWIHLPRELRGRAPVKTPRGLAVSFFFVILASEALTMAGLLWLYAWPPIAYLAGSILQIGSALAVYLHHRHQLVIHTDNVSQLLEERTTELRAAQAELARQNELLAERLAEQECDLKAKTEVIDRQRRLELAAQTAGQVAHDIQNLISPILTRIEDLEEARTLDSIRTISSGMRKQVNQLLELNTHLLALSRRGRVELQPVYLPEVVRDVAERFSGQRLTLEARGEAWVQGSAAQLSRAVSNLLTNAFESDLDRLVPVIARCGTLELAQSKRCHLGFLSPGHYATLEVEDLGPGIPGEHLDKIFEPFFSSKGKKHRSGSGLGLAIVLGVVDDHKGVLDLETGPGGTRFTLYFPLIPAPFEGEELARLSCNATVLVVDDDSSALKDYGEILRQAGYTVLLAESGAQAIRTVQAQQVDLVLLDFNMPRMNGLETFFGAMHVRPGLRAVVHSSYLTEDQAAKLRALGVSGILLKPAGRMEILRALRQAYDEGKAAVGRRRSKES